MTCRTLAQTGGPGALGYTHAVVVTVIVAVCSGMDRNEEQNGVAELNAFRSLTTELTAVQKRDLITSRP